MHIRMIPWLLLISVLLGACSIPGQGTAPTATSQPATVAPEPTTAPAATAVPEATTAPEAAATPTTSTAAAGTFAIADCAFDKPSGVTVECGYLTVPLDRATNDGKTIRLHVAIFKAKNANPQPDPIVYIEGGPGGNALQRIAQVWDVWFAPFAQDRDFIVYDQRGTGYSEQDLACPEYTTFGYDTLDQNLSYEELDKLSTETVLACHSRLLQEGADLTAYNSIESAADLDDMRKALGYDEWNLYGISYGTRLALTTMREHPDGIRSVILDSTVPTQDSETDIPADAVRSFTTLFDGCAKDKSCNAAYPNLEKVFYETVERMNKTPVTTTVQDPNSGKEYTIIINGDDMINILFQALYVTDYIPLLPLMIYAAYRDVDYRIPGLLALQGAQQNEEFNLGMYYSVRCNEEVSFSTRQEMADADAAYPELDKVFDLASYYDICQQWGAGTAPAVENEPVVSDIPTLVLSGEYDPATPPQNGEEASQTLSKSFFFEFPGLGHGVSVDGGCPMGITQAFIESPTTKPDSSCIAQMKAPEFITR